MAKWSTGLNTFTPNAVADTVNFTNLNYLAIQNGSSGSAMRTVISEVYMGGQATSSQQMYMVLAKDSTLGATVVAPAAGTGWAGPLDPNSSAMAANFIPLPFNSATTLPQRSTTATVARLNLSFNAFGGIVRWTAMDPTEVYTIYGVAVSVGEASLSAFTGSGAAGAMGCHLIYEPI